MKKLIVFIALLLPFALLFSSCRHVFGKRIRGNAVQKTQTFPIASFEYLEVSGSMDVYVLEDSVASVQVKTDENLQKYILVQQEGNVLRIRPRKHVNLRPANGIRLLVRNPVYKGITATGSCELNTESRISSSGPLSVTLSGASNARMQIKAPEIKVKSSGASHVSLSGETKDFIVTGSGASHIRCFDLLSEKTTIALSGAGDAQVHASVKLDVQVSGAADVQYRGNPELVQSISGAGSIKKAN